MAQTDADGADDAVADGSLRLFRAPARSQRRVHGRRQHSRRTATARRCQVRDDRQPPARRGADRAGDARCGRSNADELVRRLLPGSDARLRESPGRLHAVLPDLSRAGVADDVLARFQASRRAVLVPDAMAEEYGWRAGDLVPIVGDIWPRSDGSCDWEFEVAGTYGVPPESGLQPWFLLRYDYFNESVADWAKNEVGWVVARLDDGVDPKAVVDAIDRRFENSSDPTRSLSEDELSRQFANRLGDIGLIATLILAAVFFTMLLLTANVAALARFVRSTPMMVACSIGCLLVQVVCHNSSTLAHCDAVRGEASTPSSKANGGAALSSTSIFRSPAR